MQKENCFLVGTVFKLHGYKGKIQIYNDDDIFFDFNTIKYFLIEQNHLLVPFFISQAKHTKPNVILVKFEDINSEQEASLILKKKVYLPTDFLPKTDEKEIFEKEFIDFRILDSRLGELGKITYINSQTPQKLIFVSNGEKEFCFPMHEQFIININSKERIMTVNIPEDLINLN